MVSRTGRPRGRTSFSGCRACAQNGIPIAFQAEKGLRGSPVAVAFVAVIPLSICQIADKPPPRSSAP